MSGISKSQVSRLCGEIDEKVQTFLTRPLEGDWPYVWLDATYVKNGRPDGSYRSPSRLRLASTTTAGAKSLAWISARPRRRLSGPNSCAS